METRILAVWRGIGLACLLTLTTNCAADIEQKQPHVFNDKELHACYLAIAEDDRKQVAECLEKGLDPEKRYLIKRKNKETKKPLFVYFAEGHSLKDPSLKGEIAPMDQVVQFGRAEIMEMFLKAGGNPNYRNKSDVPILIRALDDAYRLDKNRNERASFPPADNRSVAFALLDRGANPNAYWQLSEKKQRTALSLAAEYNDLEMVKRLVELGADMNTPKNSNLAPLFFAAGNGNVKIVDFLLKNGADMYALNRTDPMLASTPIDIAGDSDHPEVMELFLEAGADPNKHSFLYNAIQDDASTLLQELVNKGVDVNTLYKSYYFDRLPNVPKEYLSFPREHDYTPLGFAVSKRNLKIIEMLVQRGANICKRDRNKLTAYEIAKQNGFKEIADYLASKGGANCP